MSFLSFFFGVSVHNIWYDTVHHDRLITTSTFSLNQAVIFL